MSKQDPGSCKCERPSCKDIGVLHNDLCSKDPRLRALSELARLLGFRVGDTTLHKILRLRELLSRGLTLRDAQRVLRREFGSALGWKNVEKYKLLIYMDPRVPVMPPRKFMRDHSLVFGSVKAVEQLALVLNEIAKYTTLKIVQKAIIQGRVKRTNISKEWYQLCQDLLEVWISEVSMSTLEQIS